MLTHFSMQWFGPGEVAIRLPAIVGFLGERTPARPEFPGSWGLVTHMFLPRYPPMAITDAILLAAAGWMLPRILADSGTSKRSLTLTIGNCSAYN
jgi:hypothetical protein